MIRSLQYFQSFVLHQHVVQLLEFSEGGPVVLRGSLCEDINSEVCLVDFIVVILLIFSSQALSLSSQLMEGVFQFVLFSLESLLDNLSTSEKPFLQVLKSFILDHDSCLFVKRSNIL